MITKGTLQELVPSASISERKKAEAERDIMVGFLRIANATTSPRELVKAASNFFQKQSGCEAVGIRLKEGDEYPYYVTRGFPPEHVRLENQICARDDAGYIVRDSKGNPIIECMCGSRCIVANLTIAKTFLLKKEVSGQTIPLASCNNNS